MDSFPSPPPLCCCWMSDGAMSRLLLLLLPLLLACRVSIGMMSHSGACLLGLRSTDHHPKDHAWYLQCVVENQSVCTRGAGLTCWIADDPRKGASDDNGVRARVAPSFSSVSIAEQSEIVEGGFQSREQTVIGSRRPLI
jgi:hypothetical protein